MIELGNYMVTTQLDIPKMSTPVEEKFQSDSVGFKIELDFNLSYDIYQVVQQICATHA